MRLTKTAGLAGALILSALVGGTLIGSALATDDRTTDMAANASAYCDTFLDALASELGVSRDELTAAGKAAATTTIESALADGDLTQERANRLKARIDEADGNGCGILGHGLAFGRGFVHGFERGFGKGLLSGDVWDAAADVLGVESADLRGDLRDAGSLQAVAEGQGVSYDDVKAAIVGAVQSDLDAAIADGKVTEERADAAISRVNAWLDDGGQLPAPGRGHFRGSGHEGDASESPAEESGS